MMSIKNNVLVVVNHHPSPLSHETMTIVPGEKATTMPWKPTPLQPSSVISSLVLTIIASPYLYTIHSCVESDAD
jgi:hypothetical protein